ncbi:MAG: dTDP-4-dehydrorhamnose reductase [Desulfobulbaceae bacterium]|nr:MAG: dTDP-4-dehydrorhamnose reductase [Desulfobulbaceae bacterium]
MKILIIGSGGQLGTDCVKLFGQDHQLFPVDYPSIDIGQQESVQRCFETSTPDVVINCAAYTAVDKCETERDAAWLINSTGPKYIAKAAANIGARVIHISTDYVFDGMRTVPQPYLENDQVNPLSEYGKSKLSGERAITEHCEDYAILRTAWLYSGYGQNFLKTMLRLALSDPGRNFTIVNDQFGSLTWSYTLTKQIEQLLEPGLTGIMHTTADGYSSWYEAACYFLERMDIPHAFVPCTTIDYPTPAHRPANSILKNNVLENAGLSVFKSWQEDVDQFVGEFKDALIKEVKQQLQS